jgi:hypothetical protein
MEDIDDILETGPEPIQDDGIRPPPPDDADGALPPVERELGFILDEEDEEKVAKHIVEQRQQQEPQMSRNRAVWKRNRWWREGKRWVRLNKKENQNVWEAVLPLGMSSAPPVPNKTDRLCRRLANTILVDKPYPDCEPGDASNEAKDAAEFATRYLSVKGAPAELNMARVCRAAFDKAETYASGFAWVTMDPGAGGHRPRRMLAHPKATHRDNALLDPTAGEELGIPGLAIRAVEDDLQERYVRSDGYLTDSPADADLQWLPGPKIRLLTGHHVNFIPEHARGMDDAIGVIITDVTTLGDLKKMFPERFDRMEKDDIEKLCVWRPDKFQELLPPYTKIPDDQKFEDGPRSGEYKDSQTVIAMTVYYESCAEYPLGCYAVVGGDTLVLHRQKWSALMPAPLGPKGEERPPIEECLEIPVAQCRCLDDDTTDNPYGVGIVEHLGPADEIAASSLGFELEYMFRAANPHTFLPVGTIVQPKQLRVRNSEPIMFTPGGKPEVEQIPALSDTIPRLREEMQHDQDDATGLQQAAQGVEDPSVQSGIHAQVIVDEAKKAVSNMKDNIGDFYIAVNRIILQLSRAFCTVPSLISYVGEDGAYKEREWSREDFRNTRRVSIARGSFTMHTLLAKQEMARQMKADHAIDNEDYLELVAGGVSPVLGLQDNPHLMRIRRQLDQFMKGPTPEWLAAKQQVDGQNAAAMQAYQTATAPLMEAAMITGAAPALQPAPQPIPDPPTPLSDRLPVDLEIMPAKIRHRQLSKAMTSTRYEGLHPMWKQVFLAEYAEMKNAAGIINVPDAQRVQAQAAAQAAAQGARPPGAEGASQPGVPAQAAA